MSPIVSQGLDLAVYGMGTVFLFLTVLVLATMLMSKLTLRIEATAAQGGNDTKRMAAIAAAIHQHRRQTGK